MLKVEEQVYPRPWSSALFLSELALRSTRAYTVARVGREVVGYCGVMISFEDSHVTTIAVDPAWHRHGIATRLMIGLAREALVRAFEGAAGVAVDGAELRFRLAVEWRKRRDRVR